MNLTPHFTIEEMQNSATGTRLGIKNVIPPALIANAKRVAEALELIRAHYGVSIHVTSCYRSPELNKAVGGSTSSAHMTASAADFEVLGHANIDVCNIIPSIIKDFDQIIYEFGPTGWVHLGFGDKNRKQLLSAIKNNGKTVYLQGIK